MVGATSLSRKIFAQSDPFPSEKHRLRPISGYNVSTQNFGVPSNISATAGASDSKFGALLGFAKAHQKITRRRKGGHGPWLGELSKIWGFPFNIYTMAEASDFKFDTQLQFAKAHHKTTLTGEVGLALG